MDGSGVQYGGPIGTAITGQDFNNGISTMQDWAAFVKAVQTAGNPNVLDDKANLTGVPAIRFESLETTLRAIVEREETYTLTRRLKRKPTTSSVNEFATLIGIGGDLGDVFHGEYSDIRAARSEFKRDVVRVKYLMSRGEVTLAAQLQRAVDDIKARENKSATLRIMRGLEWSLYQGDESVVPEQFDGIYTTLNRDYPDHILDMQGGSDTEAFYNAVYSSFAKVIGPEGGFGRISDIFLTPTVQNDLDMFLLPQWRVALNATNAGTEFGSPVTGIKTSFGNVGLNRSTWIEEGDYPHLTAPAVVRAKAISKDAPGKPTVTVTAQGATVGSQFTGTRGGTYWYGVAAIGEKGEGALSDIQAAAVAAGGSVRLEITPDQTLGQTGFVIYRSKQNPATQPVAGDLRIVKRIPNPSPQDPSVVVEFVDSNHDLPGASKAFILDMDDEAIQLTQLLPFTSFPLYPTAKASYPFALLLFTTLQLSIPQRAWVVKNYVPKGAIWKPHG